MIDYYKHINDGTGDGVVIGIEEIATKVMKLNYGTHRMISAIARKRLEERPGDELGLSLKGLLNRGLF